MGVRISGPLISLEAIGAGIGGAVTNAGTAHTLSTGKRAVIKKIVWLNRAATGRLLIGFGDRTVTGSLFRQTLPSILMLSGIDGEMGEDEIPNGGNTPEGFQTDTTAVTGTIGNILVETDAVGVGAAPVNVQVRIEVEES